MPKTTRSGVAGYNQVSVRYVLLCLLGGLIGQEVTFDHRYGIGNGARVHNHFCVMPEVDPCFASRHPANPAGNIITIIHSSPLGLLVLCRASTPIVHHIEALCISPRA